MEKIPRNVLLSLGSNLGDSLEQLQIAARLLERQAGGILNVSPVYRTKAWGRTDQPDFLNAVVELQTHLDAETLMQRVLDAEHAMGRERLEKWGPRSIDIDILFYGDAVIDLPALKVPHPQLHLRNFVLVPLNDIAPELLHPALNMTISRLLAICPDTSAVEKEGELFPAK
jgi:2-amino-4-hydroxy-6-hydroxymethyldihydropteridine diphosphokinase